MASAMPQPDDSGGGHHHHAATQQPHSYSDKLKLNLRKSERLKRKVLEVTLETEKGVNLNIEDKDIAKLASRIGIDIRSQLEGYQPCPGYSRKILFWFKDNVNIDNFCKDEVFKVSEGIRTGYIRPMDRKEVIVQICGLNINTPDSLVIEYLNKHGRVTKNEVIYEKVKEGPFEGLKNGNRKYLVDFTNGTNMGSYHLIDGAKVSIFYPGLKKTCGRCHEVGAVCVGGGIARVCNEKGGRKVRLEQKMLSHWKEIGFEPSNFKLKDVDDDDEDVPVHDGNNFSPVHKNAPMDAQEKEKLTGIVIKNIPEAVPNKEVDLLLKNVGIDEKHPKQINKFDGKITVEINDIENILCLEVIEKLNGTKVHDNKIYCRGLSPLYTPEKKAEHEEEINDTPNPKITVNGRKPDIPGLTISELTKSQKKREKRKKRKMENPVLEELQVKDFLKNNSEKKQLNAENNIEPGDFIFSDNTSSDDEEDAYNTCDYDSEVDPGMNKAVKVAEVVANIEAADPTYRERTLSVKRPGSPTGAGSDRVLKLKQKQ